VLDDTTIGSLLVHSNGCIIAATNSLTSRAYRSTDNGDHWSIVTDGLQGNIRSIAKNSSGHTFVSTSVSVFRSTDFGDSWSDVGLNLPALPIPDLAVTSMGFVFAATFGNGVYRTTQPTTSVGEDAHQPPETFLLRQNYPNPFNPSTVIRYQLPFRGFTSLKVFDLIGREIETLIEMEQPPGLYEATWEAGGVASGVYIARLTAGTFVASRKLVLVR